MTVDQLNKRFSLPTRAIFDIGAGGLPRLKLTSDDGECEIYPHGAHITGFTPKHEQPVLWMSGRSEFADGKPIRGGVPVCFPWFGAHPKDTSLPSHGFVRLSEWVIEAVEEREEGLSVSLSSTSNTDTHGLWPFEYTAVITVVVADTLTISLDVTNIGTSEFTFTEALHSYFAVSDIRFVTITGLDETSYIDKLLEFDTPSVQRGPIQFTSETDRPYLDTEATCIIDDPGMNRQIVIEKNGSKSTIVWNPWIQKARRMEDFGNDEWTSMVCVETANALSNAVTLAPGASHTISAKISVRHS